MVSVFNRLNSCLLVVLFGRSNPYVQNQTSVSIIFGAYKTCMNFVVFIIPVSLSLPTAALL